MILQAITIVGLLLPVADQPESCPADRPHARKVIDYTQPVMCTLMNCIGELKCPINGEQCYISPSNCNSCTPPASYQTCLSDDELKAATPRQ